MQLPLAPIDIAHILMIKPNHHPCSLRIIKCQQSHNRFWLRIICPLNKNKIKIIVPRVHDSTYDERDTSVHNKIRWVEITLENDDILGGGGEGKEILDSIQNPSHLSCNCNMYLSSLKRWLIAIYIFVAIIIVISFITTHIIFFWYYHDKKYHFHYLLQIIRRLRMYI